MISRDAAWRHQIGLYLLWHRRENKPLQCPSKGLGLRSHERNCRQHCQTLKRKALMKKILITLVCALVASPAFAQTKPNSTEEGAKIAEGATVIGIAVQ